ncbi:MAG: heavy metal translocating P-type ATPase [Promethearchaeota archaeon]
MSVAAVFLTLAIIWDVAGYPVWQGQFFAFISVLLSGPEVYGNAWRELKSRSININFLMGAAALGSFFILKGQEGATAILLYSLAELVEDYTTDRSKRAVSKLIALAPDLTLLKHEHASCPEDARPHDELAATIEVPTSSVNVGEVFVVLPGQRIPLDGRVVCGSSYVDQSSVTGESVPVLKSVENEGYLYAGTVNGDGYLEAEATSKPTDTLLARITRAIQDAQRNKSQVEKFVEKFARYYTPAVALLAVLVIVLPPLFFGQPFATWFYRGLVLLVVSCPCALTLSTPVTVVSALARLSSHGILVKGGKFVEEINKVQVFAFDKTGTLTEGKLAVHDVLARGWLGERELVQIAASLEAKSEHPIGKAILREASKRKVSLLEVEDFGVVKGRGIRGSVGGREFFLGSTDYLEGLGVPVPPESIDGFRSEGKTVIALGTAGGLSGIITVRDVIRDSAALLVYALAARGKKAVILSGDDPKTVDSIADCLSIGEYYGGLLPDEKIQKVKELRERYGSVAMVGDGINDAPALATANVGIAMGETGSDITVENADVTVMNDDLTKLIVFLNVASQTAKKLRQNIFGSISVKLTLAILTLFGYVTLWFAVGVGDMGVSIAVVLNGITLLRFRDFSFEVEDSLNGKIERTAVCVKCGEKFPAPKHCGIQMIPVNGELVCWRQVDARKVRVRGNGGGTEPLDLHAIREPVCETCEPKRE